ncbi:MFS transporter [Paenibacillus sp. 19GGS1-52]|uniref:MFS transporter n=1 Tax=Paenibacillus sp. 19GGS1-52 TaxID=2758563 RepID=UPI001EFBEA0D|nr:MFS transporter [Paenibacillus sp. 19GGS1-52]ULO06220.1 MFS transporter [Paenibacillus sp. 19GGS1-52]
MNLVKTYAGLTKEIYFLCLARTINSIGDFVFSLITLYLTLQLGMSAVSAGIFVSLAALISGPGVLLGGYLSDIMGKKTIIVGGQFLSSILIMSCIIWSGTIAVAYILIIVMFSISVTRPAYNSLLIKLSTGEKERKSAFSLMYLGANIGIAVGPLAAGFFMKNYINIVFASISIVFLLSTIIIISLVKVVDDKVFVKDKNESVNNQNTQHNSSLLTIILKRPLVAYFIIISFLNYFIYMQASFSIPIQMNSSFGENGAAYYGTVMTINAICVIILTTFILSITKKITAINSIAIGAIFYGLGFGILGLLDYSTNFIIVALSTILWTVGEILIQTNINLYIASRVPDTHQGRFNGLLLFVGCLGYTLSPYLTGIFINKIDIENVWFIISAFSLIYSVCMLSLLYLEKRSIRGKVNEELDF